MPLKLAPTDVALFRTTIQEEEDPEHAPDHPPKEPPEFGVATRVTAVPLLKLAVQVEPQLIPGGLLVTMPNPVSETLSGIPPLWKLAATDIVPFIVSVHVADEPEQLPDHPAKELPALGVAESVTVDPLLKPAAQVDPQFMPAGVLVIVPPGVSETLN